MLTSDWPAGELVIEALCISAAATSCLIKKLSFDSHDGTEEVCDITLFYMRHLQFQNLKDVCCTESQK